MNLTSRLPIATLLVLAACLRVHADPLGSAFTYQGHLKSAGSPATGPHVMVFTLFDAAEIGNQVGPTLTFDGQGGNAAPVSVDNGLFTVELDFGAAVFSGQRRWLEITVEGVTLSPRQELTATPYARRAAYASGPWETFGSDIAYLYGRVGIGLDLTENSLSVLGGADFTGNVGIGTPTPGQKLSVVGGATIDQAGQSASGLQFGLHFGNDTSGEGIASWRFCGGTGCNTNGLDLYTNNTARLSIRNNGNVGIGTNQPGNKLSIVGGVTIDGGGSNSGTLANAIRFGGDTQGEGIASRKTVGANQHGLDFFTSSISRLSITQSGNVGIGTSAPASTLSVLGNADVSGNLGIGTGSPTAPLDVLNSMRITNSDPAKYVEIKTTGALTDIKSAGAALALNYEGTQNVYLCAQGGRVGIGTDSPGSFTLTVDGSAAKPGGGSWSVFSDARLKRNVAPMTGTLDKVLAMHGREFDYTDEAIASKFGLPGRQIGLIAQEVERIFPDWVSRDDEGYLYVTERGTTALMVEALRDLRAEKDEQLARRDTQIASLNERIAALERLVGRLASAQSGGAQ